VRPLGSRSSLRENLHGFLDGLGADGRQVAARLIEDGVSGIPRSTSDCAIARYLKAILGGDSRVASLEVTRDWLVARRAFRHCVKVPLPEPVKEFVALFDDGAFPELILPRSRTSAPTKAEE
jgi:hypothetical protein